MSPQLYYYVVHIIFLYYYKEEETKEARKKRADFSSPAAKSFFLHSFSTLSLNHCSISITLRITLLFTEMNYLARAATAAVVIAFVKLFLGRRRRNRSSDDSNDSTSSQQSNPTPDSVDSDSVPLPTGEYEVFLSFRGPDTRDSITDILYRFLAHLKIRTFRDDDELRKGEGIWSNLVKAISQSKISIPIFSPRYAESKWCLKELAEIIEHRKREKGHIILPIFYMVDPGDVRRQTGPYEVAFTQHKRNGFDEETIQCWKAALTEVGSLKGEVDVADDVYRDVWSHLSKNNNKLEINELVGIDDQVEQVEDMLDLGSQGVKVVGLHGMGGIGKTTLATAVYNKVSAYFDRYSFVKDIRETQKQHDGVLILYKKLISNILRMDSVESIVDISEAKKIIRESITRFKILVVLDDVDEKFKFEEVLGDPESFASGSRFIVTSRDKKVMGSLSKGQSKLYEVQGMDPIRSLQLFCKHAFKKDSPQSGFEALSNKIISTTGGLPLTLKVIGSLLYQEEEVVWKEKLEQLRKIPEEEVMERLKISYDGLRYEAQQIFLDIACFCIGENKEIASYMWSDCDLYPTLNVNILVQRSMLNIGDENEFLMHDQLRDMGREIVRREDIERPWMRSRIWSKEEAHELLLNNKGTNQIKSIRLANSASDLLEVGSSCFTDMSELRYFAATRTSLIGNFNQVLPNLKWMELRNNYNANYSSLPTLNVKNLIILIVDYPGDEITNNIKEAHKLKVLVLENCSMMSKLPEFPESGNLEILEIQWFTNKEEDLKIEKLQKLKVLRLKDYCKIGKIKGGTIGTVMKGLRELNLFDIHCDYDTFRQTIVDIEELSSLQILNVNSCCLKDVLEGIKLPKSLKKLNTSSGFANVEELLELEEFTIWAGTELVIPPVAGSSRGGDTTSSTIIPWIHSSKLKEIYLLGMKRIIMVEIKDITMLPSSLTKLTISHVDSELILNLKNLRNLTELKIEKCPNLEEIQGMGGLKSLQVLLIVGARKLTHIHGLGNLMSSSNCKLTELVIRDCPLLREVVTFEQQDDDDDGGGSEGGRERYVLVQIESLVTMEITKSPSIDWRSIPRLSKFPMLKEIDVADVVSGDVWSHLSKNNNKLETDDLVEIDDHVQQVEDMLDLGSQGVNLVGLHGMGGIGKTTLATAVYNKVSACFDLYSFVKDIRETQKQHDGVLVIQKKLISNILRMKSVESIVDVSEAKKIIQERVTQLKILVVLDDVDENFNFEGVLGNLNFFASGSRFIVTSRDKKVLGRLSGDQSKLYEVQGMNPTDSLQLFCKHAFKKNYPQSGFEALSNAIVDTAAGLPLTLKVIGSLLYQEEEVVWNDKLEQLRKIPEKVVTERLKISYDGLTYEAQQIFLDIACFYIGENKEFPSYMWSDCNFHPISNINILVQRSMLNIGDENEFLMHDQLRDMGREIVRREDIERPWMRSRIWSYEEAHELLRNNKEANKLKVLILSGCQYDSKLPEFPKSGSLEILEIYGFRNREEDLKIEKLQNLKVLKLQFCTIGKIKGGTIGTMMKGLRELHLTYIGCDYEAFRQTIVDIKELSSLEILNVLSDDLVDVLEGIKLPKSLKKLQTSSDFANVEELLELEEFTIWDGTELVIPPAAGSSRGGDTSSTLIPWIHSSKLKEMKLELMKRITMVESKDITMLPSSLTELTISNVGSEQIPNLKNLRNLTELRLSQCPNLEEIHGMGGLKSLQVLLIYGARKLTRIHGLGNLMSSSNCELTQLVICKCPLLREIVTFEKQDDDGGGDDDGGNGGDGGDDDECDGGDGDGDDEDFLVAMEILNPSIGRGPTPRLPMVNVPEVKYMKISELTMVLKGTENNEDLSERKPLLSFLSKLNKRLSNLILEDVPALLEEIVGAGYMKELCLIMNDFLSLHRRHFKDLPYSTLHRIEVDCRLRSYHFMKIDFDLSSLTTEGDFIALFQWINSSESNDIHVAPIRIMNLLYNSSGVHDPCFTTGKEIFFVVYCLSSACNFFKDEMPIQFYMLEMDYLALTATVAVIIIAFYMLFLGRRRYSVHSNDASSHQQPNSTPDSGDSDTVPLPIGEYEVFLNFRGPDTRYNITKILHSFLTRSKIRTFMDDDELRKGEGIWSNLVKAISQSKISIPIFSPRYAESKWCLKELAEIIEHRKREKGHIILPIFYLVDPGDVRRQTGPYEEAFKQHKRNINFDEETIQCWKVALTEIGSLKGWHIKTKEEEVDVADVVSGVVWSHLSKNNNKLETDELVGIDDQVEQVEDMLDLNSEGVKVVGLHGMGGIGKTTLATTVYNEVSARFDRYSFVKDIRETQKQHCVLGLQKKLISNILRMDSVESIVDVSEAMKIIQERVTRFKILVVLDDVDEKFNFEEVLGNSKSFASGSRFIVTSRDIKVLRRLSGGQNKLYKVQGMNLTHSLQLFCKHAFKKDSPQSGFEVLSNAIISTAGGLPLTLKVIGSLLYQEEEVVWKEKLEQLRKIPEEEVMERLKISYDGLRYEAQQIFLDIACFYIGENKEIASYMWSDCDFYPKLNVNILVQRSMLNIGDGNEFLMHDQLRDMGREIVRREDIERPWMRSRIWLEEEARELLLNNKGTNQIKSIRLDPARDMLPVGSSCFTDMSELRYFAASSSTSLIGNFNQVLPNLKWMQISDYPSFSSLNVKNLIILVVESPRDEVTKFNIKEANKLKVLILSICRFGLIQKLPEFPESGSLEILEIYDYSNREEEDLKIEKLQNLKVLKLEGCCKIGKIKGGTIGTMMKGLRELHLFGIVCDYNTFRQTIVDIEELSSLQILEVESPHLEDVLEGIKLPKSLKKLHTSSGFANVEELLDLEEFTIKGSIATTKLAIPPAASSRGGDTSSTIIPWIHSSKLKEMKLLGMKRIIMVESKEDIMLPSSLTELTIYYVHSEQIPNLKNLRNLTELKIEKCPNLEEIQGMGGLKSLQVLRIDGAKKLTGIHGLGNLMSCSSCKLTYLYIWNCPLLREVVTFEQQDDDDGGSDGERERYLLVQIESLVRMKIEDSPSFDWRSIPKLSKFPMLKELTINNIGLNINEESASQQGQHQQLKGLVDLSISNVDSKQILNLKNLGNLTTLHLEGCHNLEEVQGMEGLKSLQILKIEGARKLTRIHGLGNLMSCSSCELTKLVIRECPLLHEVGTFEQQDDDDGGSEGDDVNNDDDVLVKMKISSIDGRSTTPMLSKLPKIKYMTFSEYRMAMKGIKNQNPEYNRTILVKLIERLRYLRLEDFPALQEIVGAGGFKELWLLMNKWFSFEIKDLPYSSLHRVEFDDRRYSVLKSMEYDFDLSSLSTEGGDLALFPLFPDLSSSISSMEEVVEATEDDFDLSSLSTEGGDLGELRFAFTWPHEEMYDMPDAGEMADMSDAGEMADMSDAESNYRLKAPLALFPLFPDLSSSISSMEEVVEAPEHGLLESNYRYTEAYEVDAKFHTVWS
ncbi:Disease resistance protein L6 [Linum perenne]